MGFAFDEPLSGAMWTMGYAPAEIATVEVHRNEIDQVSRVTLMLPAISDDTVTQTQFQYLTILIGAFIDGLNQTTAASFIVDSMVEIATAHAIGVELPVLSGEFGNVVIKVEYFELLEYVLVKFMWD